MAAPHDQADADSITGSTKVDGHESGDCLKSSRTVTALQYKDNHYASIDVLCNACIGETPAGIHSYTVSLSSLVGKRVGCRNNCTGL